MSEQGDYFDDSSFLVMQNMFIEVLLYDPNCKTIIIFMKTNSTVVFTKTLYIINPCYFVCVSKQW